MALRERASKHDAGLEAGCRHRRAPAATPAEPPPRRSLPRVHVCMDAEPLDEPPGAPLGGLQTDFAELRQAWINEKAAPEILQCVCPALMPLLSVTALLW